MNSLTKFKHYLDRCVGGGNPENSKFRIVRRTFDNERNRHTVEISYSYRDPNELQVPPTNRRSKSDKRRLYDEIIKATKVRIAEQ